MGLHSADPIPSVSHKPVSSSFGAVGPPMTVVLPEETYYTLFGDDAHNNSFFSMEDFTQNNKFHDDPRLSHIFGGLMGPDGAPLRRISVEDEDVCAGVVRSVLSQVKFSLEPNKLSPAASATGIYSNAEAPFANDSGTEFTFMTLYIGSK